MIANKIIIEGICKKYNLKVNSLLEEYIIQEYGNEPFPYSWSEQDLSEQIRKLIIRYDENELTIKIKTTEERWQDERERLQDVYIECKNELYTLMDHLHELENIIKENNLSLPNEHLDF